jgi:transposase
MTYSDDLRWRIVWKIWEGMSQREVARELIVPQSSVSDIWRHFKRYGFVNSLGGQGRPPLLDQAGLDTLELLVDVRPCCYLDEYCTELSELLGIKVSLSTLCRSLHVSLSMFCAVLCCCVRCECCVVTCSAVLSPEAGYHAETIGTSRHTSAENPSECFHFSHRSVQCRAVSLCRRSLN